MAGKAEPEKSGSACGVFGEYRLAEEDQRFFETENLWETVIIFILGRLLLGLGEVAASNQNVCAGCGL